MRRFLTIAVVGLLLGCLAMGGQDTANAQSRPGGRVQPPEYPGGHGPAITRGRPSAQPAPSGVATPGPVPYVVPVPVAPYSGWYDPYAYPYGSYDYPYGYYQARPWPYPPVPYYSGPIVFPPVVVPGEPMFGPEAVKRFMGLDRQPNPPTPDLRRSADREPKREAEPPNLRGTGTESIAMAQKFIGFGDNQFAKQRYVEAFQRYKKAAQAAPGLAESYFRQGFALIATSRYELSAKAFKQGLKVDPGWPRSGFTLERLYGQNRAAETAHREALAQAVDKEQNNADLLFLLGILLHFDGQTDRAETFFQRAAQLSGGSPEHLKGFLKGVESEE